MKTIIIPAKMSNTGSIYDIASQHYDIEIPMPDNFIYVVILPSYYNAGYTRHKSAGAAIRQYKKLSRDGYQGVTILNRDGKEMIVNFNDELTEA